MKHWLSPLVFAVLITLAAVAQEVPSLQSLRSSATKLQPLMQKKTKPEIGDWLTEHHEDGQTFDQYLTSGPNRPIAGRATLYIQPIGDFSKLQVPLIKDTAEILGIHFGVPVKILDALPDSAIPDRARRIHPTWGMKQFLSTYILNDVLMRRRTRDAVAVLGLTTTDLFPQPSWNFVFGQASLSERVGVWSLARYGDAEKDYAVVLRRTLQVATHETGHMFGLQHCTVHECGMNGSNNLPESDRAPMPFCSECDLKLWWACRLDPVARYIALADFAKVRGLAKEEGEWRRRAALLK